MAKTRFAFSVDDARLQRLKNYANGQGASAAAVLKAVIDRLPTPDGRSVATQRDAAPTTKITIRLTAAEAERLDRHVTATGFDTRTSWATRVLLQAVTNEPPFSEKELIELRRARSEFAAVGRNLNQIARALNIDMRNDGPSEKLLIDTLLAVDSHKHYLLSLIQKAELRGRDRE